MNRIKGPVLISSASLYHDILTFFVFALVIFSFSDLTKVIAQTGGEVIATVPVGDHPFQVAYNPGNGFMYVVNQNSDSVSVIDQNNDVVDTVTVGDFPIAVAFNPGNKNMYVVNGLSESVSVIDQNNNVVDTITVEIGPQGVAYNPGNGFMYVANQGIDTVSVIDQNNNVVDTIEVESDPISVAYNPGNGFMYVANLSSDTVSVIGTITPLEGIIGSGNNINIQVQENSGNNVGGQSGGDGNSYSDFPIFQGQSTSQDSSVVS